MRACRAIQLGRYSLCPSAAATSSLEAGFSSSAPPTPFSASKPSAATADDPSPSTAGASGGYQASETGKSARDRRETSSTGPSAAAVQRSPGFPWSSPPSRAAAAPSPPRIPVRHSRHKLPLVCTDRSQLDDLTRQVLESKALFQYRDGRDGRDDAWDAASGAVQKVEFLLRGHSRLLPGTQWNRWLPPREPELEDPNRTLAAMQSLVDRLWEDGHAYMSVRSGRMEELHGPKTSASPSYDDEESRAAPGRASALREVESSYRDDDDESSGDDSSSSSSDEEDNESEFDLQGAMDLADFFGQGGGASADGTTRPAEGEIFAVSLDEEDEGAASYLNDFSLPGPTTHMFDILLDGVACHPTEPRQGFVLLQEVLGRHGLDGGDERNRNEHTRPTVLSYNAPIRLAANLPYDGSSSSSSSAELRDEALQLALGSFDALGHSSIVSRNSATYTYLLRVIAKYLRTGETRGNIALGIFHHGRVQGLVDDAVLDAFRAAHTPSNGKDFERWISKYLGSPDRPAKDLPHRWRRHGRVRRYHPREATY